MLLKVSYWLCFCYFFFVLIPVGIEINYRFEKLKSEIYLKVFIWKISLYKFKRVFSISNVNERSYVKAQNKLIYLIGTAKDFILNYRSVFVYLLNCNSMNWRIRIGFGNPFVTAVTMGLITAFKQMLLNYALKTKLLIIRWDF